MKKENVVDVSAYKFMKVGDDIIPFDERKIVEDFFKDKE